MSHKKGTRPLGHAEAILTLEAWWPLTRSCKGLQVYVSYWQVHLAALMGQFQKLSEKRWNNLVLEVRKSEQCECSYLIQFLFLWALGSDCLNLNSSSSAYNLWPLARLFNLLQCLPLLNGLRWQYLSHWVVVRIRWVQTCKGPRAWHIVSA